MRGEKPRPKSITEKTRPSFFRSLLRSLFIFLLFALVPLAYFGYRGFYVTILELQSPEIFLQEVPAGIGLQPTQIKIVVSDKDSGLEEVIIRSFQNGSEKILQRLDYAEKTDKDVILLEIPGKASGLRQGDVRISITAFDRSFRSNGKTENIDLVVDYSKPKIEVLTTQHNAIVGGAELTFYQLDQDKDVSSGLRAGGGWLFPGFLAKEFDTEFASRPKVFFSLFAVPLEFRPDEDQLQIFAKNHVGNLTLASLFYRAKDVGNKKRKIKLDQEYLEGTVTKLAKEYQKSRSAVSGTTADINLEGSSSTDLVGRFQAVNNDYRDWLEESIRPLFQRPRRHKLWQGKFLPFPGITKATFGDQLLYTFNDLDAGQSTHLGVDFSLDRNAEVRAANSGVVIFSDVFGVYGNTIIVDHGFGLYSLYAHLAKNNVSEGTQLQKGEIVGIVGSSGLSPDEHLHFEIRVHGVPVNPYEWWDENWIEGHIEHKIRDVKKTLGIAHASPLAN